MLSWEQSESKNPAAIAEIAEKLSNRHDIQFVIGGRGDSEYADTVRKDAEGLPNVKYIGELGEKTKVQLIQNSYLNIILSRMEALGLTQLEFMFEGVPIITSGVGGQSWIVRNGQEGIQVNDPMISKGRLPPSLTLRMISRNGRNFRSTQRRERPNTP